MKAIPKIARKSGGDYSYPVRTKYTEINQLFPRGQHPDERTNKEFLRDLDNKLFVNKVLKKARHSEDAI